MNGVAENDDIDIPMKTLLKNEITEKLVSKNNRKFVKSE